MKFKEGFSETTEVIKEVLSNKKYLSLTIITGVLAFIALYYLIVIQIADNNIWIAAMMTGAGYITESLISVLLLSSGIGIYLSLIVYKYNTFSSIYGKSLFGFIGSGIGAFGVGCPTCGAFLFGLIGAPLALMYLPFKGAELRILGIIILAVSIYFTTKSIRNNACKINFSKRRYK